MTPIIVLLLSIPIFIFACFIIRVKDIDLPGYDRIDNLFILIFLYGVCLIWPISLPVVIIGLVGLVITGKHKDL